MNPTPEQLAQQLAALTDRVLTLEAEVTRLRRAPGLAPEGAAGGASPGRREGVPGSLDAAAARFRKRAERPSLEARIGSQWFNRIGILALLIGAAWFLKFAIDRQWIGPLPRALIGIGAGLGLVAWSEWFRLREYKAFSYSLKALGTGLLYLSVWAAYTLFGLVPAIVAFGAMVLITVGNAWLCWRQNSEVLAFYAAIGGLLTPLLLWTTEGRELTLFGYLLLLDLAALALVALRPWSRLLLAAFAGTAFYAVGWYVQHYTPVAFGLTTFFVAAFFLLFSAAPQLLRNLRLASGSASPTFEDHLTLLLLPLLNGTLAFAELYALLSEPVASTWRPWVAFGFAAFYLGMLRVARSPRLAGTPTRLPDTYTLLSVIALTGAIALGCSGRSIAVGWSAESVLLVGLSWRYSKQLLRQLGTAVLGLAFTGTVTLNSALHGEVRMLLNRRFGSYLAGVAAGVWMAALAGRLGTSASITEESEGSLAPGMAATAAASRAAWRWDGLFATIGATVLLMVGVCLEIGTYWAGQLDIPVAERLIDEQFSYSAWSMVFGAVLLATGFWRKAATLRWLGLVLLALSIGKVFLFDLRELSQGYRIFSFLGLGVLLLGVSFVYQRDLLGLRKGSG